MAVLSNEDRVEIWRDIMNALSGEREPCALTKTDLRAAIDAADAWVDANKASYNNALPAAARTALTPAQKARLLTIVIKKRFEKGA